ncbi:MAG: alpha/beta fold hydrolase [Acidiferrobacterales bacterium]
MPFVRTPGIRIHYKTAGEGHTALLLLHGNFGSWRWWQPVLERLPLGYRAYAPDMRGCGDSEHPGFGHNIDVLAADVAEFAAALDLTSVHLVGHSLGAAVALQCVLDRPTLVHSLTLVAPPPAEGRSVVRQSDLFLHWVSRLFDVNRDASVVTLGATYRLLRHLGANRPLLRRALMRLAPSLCYDDAFIELVSDAARMAPQAVVGHLQALDSWDVTGELRALRKPTLILGGVQDVLISADALKRLARQLPRSRLVAWHDVGHSPQLERPDRFIHLLESFIDQVLQPWWRRPGRWLQRLRTAPATP